MAVLEKLIVAQVVKKFPALIEPDESLLCSQSPFTGLCMNQLNYTTLILFIRISANLPCRDSWHFGFQISDPFSVI